MMANEGPHKGGLKHQRRGAAMQSMSDWTSVKGDQSVHPLIRGQSDREVNWSATKPVQLLAGL